MNSVFSKIQRSVINYTLTDQDRSQKIRDLAYDKYVKQYADLIKEIDFMNSNSVNFYALQYTNIRLKQLLEKLKQLFDRCKMVCKPYAKKVESDDLDQMETNNKYAYANVCKSFRVIDDCIKFVTLCKLFEIPLRLLKTKIDRLSTANRYTLRNYPSLVRSRSRRRIQNSISRSKSRSKSRSMDKKSPEKDQLDLFYKRVREFFGFIPYKET